MDKSESIKELATALSKAQGEMGSAHKSADNPFFKSKYADLASVTDAIKASLKNNGLSYTQVIHDMDKSACVETMIFHSSGEWLSTGKLSVPVAKADAQGFGSALTYARRYGLSAAFGVASDDDDGNAAAKAKPKPESSKSVAQSDYDKLPDARKKTLDEICAEIVATFNDTGSEEAYDMYVLARDGLDLIEEKAAMKALIPSNIRTTFGKIVAARKVAENQPPIEGSAS